MPPRNSTRQRGQPSRQARVLNQVAPVTTLTNEEDVARALEPRYPEYGYHYHDMCRRGLRRASFLDFVQYLAELLHLKFFFTSLQVEQDHYEGPQKWMTEIIFGPLRGVSGGPTKKASVNNSCTIILYKLIILLKRPTTGPNFHWIDRAMPDPQVILPLRQHRCFIFSPRTNPLLPSMKTPIILPVDVALNYRMLPHFQHLVDRFPIQSLPVTSACLLSYKRILVIGVSIVLLLVVMVFLQTLFSTSN